MTTTQDDDDNDDDNNDDEDDADYETSLEEGTARGVFIKSETKPSGHKRMARNLCTGQKGKTKKKRAEKPANATQRRPT